jgi:hypothetical protein
VLYVLVTQWTQRQRAAMRLLSQTLQSADDSSARVPIPRSSGHRLVGRPAQLVRVRGTVIPVEHKRTARRLQPSHVLRSHVLQVAAECFLVQQEYGVRPPYGIVVWAGGVRQRVAFSSELEPHLLDTMAQMRAFLRRRGARARLDKQQVPPLWLSGDVLGAGSRPT